MSEFVYNDCGYTFILCRVNKNPRLPMTIHYEMFWDEEVLKEDDAVNYVEQIVNKEQLQIPMFIPDDKKYLFGFVLSHRNHNESYACHGTIGYAYSKHYGAFELLVDTYCGECEESVYDLVRAMTCNMVSTKRDSSFFMKFWSLHTDVPTKVNVLDVFDKNMNESEVRHSEGERMHSFLDIPIGFHVVEHNDVQVCFCGELVVNAFKNTIKEFTHFLQKDVEFVQQQQIEEVPSQTFTTEFSENDILNG